MCICDGVIQIKLIPLIVFKLGTLQFSTSFLFLSLESPEYNSDDEPAPFVMMPPSMSGNKVQN